MLPGGKAVAYAASNSLTIPARLAILELENRRVTEFDLELLAPLGFLADQFIYVSLSGSLMAVGFDSKSKRIVGEPVRLDDGVLGNPTGGVKAALSASGTLVYLSGRQQLQLVLVRAGATSAPTVLGESGMYSSPRFSPDGRRIAMTVVSPTNTSDVWIYDRPRNTFTRLTTEGMNVRPEWTPDGRDVVFISTRSAETGIWRQPADGSRPAERIFQPEHEPFEAVMSPDMKWLVFRTGPGTISSRDILAVPLSGERKAISIVAGPDAETMPRLSPDGQWLAYQSSESGRFEIYVRRFPGPGARVQVSDSGGTEPMWSRTGRSLYYRNQEGAVVEVVVPPGTEFSIGQRRVVVSADYLTDASHPNYDVGPEGFLLLRGAGSETQAIIVHNWSREVVEKTRKR
jgi:serine/threonine-protein kinase